MDIASILKLIGPILEPSIQSAVEGYWPKIDAAIASIGQADEKMILQAMSPVLKQVMVAELKKYLLPA